MTTEDDIALWDAEAEAFDEPADHGLRDPIARSAWTDLLLDLLPAAPARVADRKTEGVTGIRFVRADAFDPRLPRAGYDAELCRHRGSPTRPTGDAASTTTATW